MEELTKHGQIGLAAMKSGMDRKTARRYVATEQLPSQTKRVRNWRTRPNPFEDDWPRVIELLREAPTLEAKSIFQHLQEIFPGRYQDGQLRTLQRQIKRWRAKEGPPKEVFFAQEHRAGEAMQTDFTSANRLKVTIGGEPFPHLICHSVLPYSNWESATACLSESMPALKRGVQTALFRLGCVPEHHQTDHSTAATHRDLGASSCRAFNREYLDFCKHFAITPRTTAVGAKEQNGDVESLNRRLKGRLEQRLLLRGSRDFASLSIYESWLWDDCKRANGGRTDRLAQEVAVMKPLPATKLAEYSEIESTVTSGSTIRIRKNVYSVPSRLIGEKVKVRISDRRLEVYYGGVRQLSVDRLRGESHHDINYRHVIDSLVRKPGAFERYRYRDDLFPSLVFRRAYDHLKSALSGRAADLHYLRILQLAAKTSEALVQGALVTLRAKGELPVIEEVKSLSKLDKPVIPTMAEIKVDLCDFDSLLAEREEMIG